MVTSAEYKKAFAKRFRSLLYASDIAESGRGHQKQLAKLVKVSQKSVSKWCEGEAVPSPDKIITIASLLNVSPAYISYGDKQAQPPGQLKIACVNSKNTATFIFDCPLEKSEKMVAYKVVTDEASPAFEKGDILAIDQLLTPKPGDVVLIQQGDNYSIGFYKILSQEGDKVNYMIERPNDKWGSIIASDNTELVGVMIQAKRVRTG